VGRPSAACSHGTRMPDMGTVYGAPASYSTDPTGRGGSGIAA
jgi:hypothetical protein